MSPARDAVPGYPATERGLSALLAGGLEIHIGKGPGVSPRGSAD